MESAQRGGGDAEHSDDAGGLLALSGTPVPTLAGILSGALLANLAFKDLLR